MYDDVDHPALVAEDEGSKLGVHDLTGTITVRNPHGARKTYKRKATKTDILAHAEK